MRPRPSTLVALIVVGEVALGGCGKTAGPPTRSAGPVTLTIGYGLPTGQNPTIGLQQVAKNIALESLVTFSPDGRARPGLVAEWTSSPGDLRLRLRRGVKFNDQSPFDAAIVSRILSAGLSAEMGPAFEDVDRIEPADDAEVRIRLRRPSAFLLETLNLVAVQKPDSKEVVGTGPFAVVSRSADAVEMRRNEAYYQERPAIDRIAIKSFGTQRTAWAEMLRGQIDMLYEVDVQALDALEQSSTVRVVTFPQNYAYVIVLNTRYPALRDPRVRAALNGAIDRPRLIDIALKGHGTPAMTSVLPQLWAYDREGPAFAYDPAAAETILGHGHARLAPFTCLTVDGSPYDRIAVETQRQLAAVGVDMKVEGVDLGTFIKRAGAADFDAILVRARIGGGMSRPYQFWHSQAPQNYGRFSSAIVDRELDAIRHATDDDTYRRAVSGFQKAIVADPPAIFLAWAEGARAVSTRFDVPIERGRDFLGTIRFWRPAADNRPASRN
jgi:peptide/nickel transport system substrate-binding protein